MSLQVLRLVVAYLMGAFFLVESLNPDFLRSGAPVPHLLLALFGAAWVTQAVVIQRRLNRQQS